MYEPVLMSKQSFDRLNKQQQDALTKAGKKSEDYFNKATKGLDDEMVATFKKNNVEVVTLTPAEYDAWVKIAQESSYKQFASRSSRRQEADRRGARGQIMPDHHWPAGRSPAGMCLSGDEGVHMDQFRPRRHAALADLRRRRRGADRGQRGRSSARWCSSATCSTRTRSGRPTSSPSAIVAATFIGSPYVLLNARPRQRRRAAALSRAEAAATASRSRPC